MFYVTGIHKSSRSTRERTGGYDSDPTYSDVPILGSETRTRFCVTVDRPYSKDRHIPQKDQRKLGWGVIDSIKKYIRIFDTDTLYDIKIIPEDEFYDDLAAYTRYNYHKLEEKYLDRS